MPVDWIVPSEDDLKDYLAGAAYNAFVTAALASGQSSPFADVRKAICDQIRADIERNYTLSATENAVPPSLKAAACLLILERLQGRLPLEGVDFLAGHKEALKDARQRLRDIMKGDLDVETPSDPLEPPTSQGTSNAELVVSSTRVVTRAYLQGL